MAFIHSSVYQQIRFRGARRLKRFNGGCITRVQSLAETGNITFFTSYAAGKHEQSSRNTSLHWEKNVFLTLSVRNQLLDCLRLFWSVHISFSSSFNYKGWSFPRGVKSETGIAQISLVWQFYIFCITFFCNLKKKKYVFGIMTADVWWSQFSLGGSQFIWISWSRIVTFLPKVN